MFIMYFPDFSLLERIPAFEECRNNISISESPSIAAKRFRDCLFDFSQYEIIVNYSNEMLSIAKSSGNGIIWDYLVIAADILEKNQQFIYSSIINMYEAIYDLDAQIATEESLLHAVWKSKVLARIEDSRQTLTHLIGNFPKNGSHLDIFATAA